MSLLSELIAQLRAVIDENRQTENELQAARQQSEESLAGVRSATDGSDSGLVDEGIAQWQQGIEKLEEAQTLMAGGNAAMEEYIAGPLLGGSGSVGGTPPGKPPTLPSSTPAAQSSGSPAKSWSDLADFRKRAGMTVAGGPDDRDTAAKLEVGGRTFYGRNAHGRTINIKVNSITKTHAEAEVFQQLKDAGGPTKHAVLYVDRDLCPPCGPSGGVGSLMRGAGVDTLTVHSPSGTFTIDATKRPSRPTPVSEPP
ncbi:hypothetical protein GCM10029992_36460 [Glycomyces albus]